jgi:DNA adenine methylase Dam
MSYINPPLNYTGSKIKLLDQILPLFDYTKNHFIDLFCGGGSVYVNVLDKYEKVTANDIIKDLIGIHNNLCTNPESFIETVRSLSKTKQDQKLYLDLRESYNKEKSSEKLFALILGCTNNMMRFNLRGDFNQTWGKRELNENTEKKLESFTQELSKYREKITYENKNFFEIELKEHSMVYCDPPYTNTEAGYNAFWSIELEKKLYDFIKKLDNEGHSFALSGLLGEHKNNKRSEIIDKLIEEGYEHRILEFDYEYVARKKNSKNSQEVLIYNYSPQSSSP